MRVKRLSHISLNSRDLTATERFYVDVMGFEIAHEFRNAAGERYGFFLHAGGGSFIECFRSEHAPAPGAFRHLCFEVDDLEGFADPLKAYGIADVALRRGRTDHVLQFSFVTPDGIEVEIQQHDTQSVLKPYVPED